MFRICSASEELLAKYANDPETTTEIGPDAVPTIPTCVGAAGLLMLKTCSVFEPRLAT